MHLVGAGGQQDAIPSSNWASATTIITTGQGMNLRYAGWLAGLGGLGDNSNGKCRLPKVCLFEMLHKKNGFDALLLGHFQQRMMGN